MGGKISIRMNFKEKILGRAVYSKHIRFHGHAV